MKKFDVMIALEGIAEAKGKWAKAQTKFNSDVTYMMTRLLHEAARNYMSPEEVAKASGFTAKRIRQMMRDIGLNPRDGKNLLSRKAAEALAENSALMGIEPHEMDLTSPLAYLPMGSVMRQELADKTVSQVTELPEDSEVSGNPVIDALTEMKQDIEDYCTLVSNHAESGGCTCFTAAKQISNRIATLAARG